MTSETRLLNFICALPIHNCVYGHMAAQQDCNGRKP